MRGFMSIILIGTLALGITACAKEPALSTAAFENTEVTTEAPAEDPLSTVLYHSLLHPLDDPKIFS